MARVTPQPSQKRKKEYKSLSEEDSNSFNESYNISKKNVPLKEIISTKLSLRNL